MEPRLPIYFNDGMGVESFATILRLHLEPEMMYFRINGRKVAFDWDQVIMLTSQTGDEDAITRFCNEEYKLPIFRERNIRYVQIARAGPLEKDGIVILDDTRQPHTIFIEGAYKLSDELKVSGTVPQFGGGVHKCALKFKRFTAETFVSFDLNGTKVCSRVAGEGEVCADCRKHRDAAADAPGGGVIMPAMRAFGFNVDEAHRISESEKAFRDFNESVCGLAFGYNADETSRIKESDAAIAQYNQKNYASVFGFNADEVHRLREAKQYDIAPRIGIYFLELWGWSRQTAYDYIKKHTGIGWPRSRCSYCPFNSLTESDIERHRAHPAELADALLVEHIALAINPRSTLYPKSSLYEIAVGHDLSAGLKLFDAHVDSCEHSFYRVRRIYYPKKGDVTKKGTTDRAVERLATGTRAEMQREFTRQAKGLLVERHLNHLYAYKRHRSEVLFPTGEEFYVVCPSTVETKARYSMERFDQKWHMLIAPDAARLSPGQIGLNF
jgi:hypothetical protein